MNTLRLTMTNEMKEAMDWMRVNKWPTLTEVEILKASFGENYAMAKKSNKFKLDYSEPTDDEMMLNAERVWSLDEGDQYEEPFWDDSKVKPYVS